MFGWFKSKISARDISRYLRLTFTWAFLMVTVVFLGLFNGRDKENILNVCREGFTLFFPLKILINVQI